VAEAIEVVYKSNLERHYSVLAQHFEEAGDHKNALEYYRLAGQISHLTQSEKAAAGFCRKAEEMIDIVYSIKIRKSFWEKGYFVFVYGIMPLFAFYALFSVFSDIWPELVSNEVGVDEIKIFMTSLSLLLVFIYLFFLTLSIARAQFSFLIYPDRIRVQNNKKVADIPFDRIGKINILSLSDFSKRSSWNVKERLAFFLSYCGKRYINVGDLTNSSPKDKRTIGIVTVQCAGLRWPKKGYRFFVNDSQQFYTSLQKALNRYKAIESAQVKSLQ